MRSSPASVRSVIAAAFLWGTSIVAASFTNEAQVITNPPPELSTDLSFAVGEELIYRIYWGLIPVGESHITTTWVEYEGRPCLAIRARTKTNKVLEKLYPVDDVIETLIDPSTFLPIRFTKNMSEGRHRTYEVILFDHARQTARWKSILKDRTKEMPIDPDTRDLVAFMYHLRSRTFTPETTEQYRVMADDKIYDLWLKCGDYEKVKLPLYGAIRSLEIEPDAVFQGLFVRKGRMWVWVAAEGPRLLITKITASVPVANIRLLLIEVRGPGNDFWVTVPRESGNGKSSPPSK